MNLYSPTQIKSDDPRAKRTQLLLRDALMALIEEKSYEKIRVGDIVTRAKVARPTFYAHYENNLSLEP